jgi:hypothetical protein
MNSNEIAEYLVGVPNLHISALDQLPMIKFDKTVYLIFNTKSSNQKGEHWCMCILSIENDKRNIYALDSLGLGCVLYNQIEWINMQDPDMVTYNRWCLQSPTSSACGAFVVSCVLHMHAGGKFDEYLCQFTGDLLQNEVIAKNLCAHARKNE